MDITRTELVETWRQGNTRYDSSSPERHVIYRSRSG